MAIEGLDAGVLIENPDPLRLLAPLEAFEAGSTETLDFALRQAQAAGRPANTGAQAAWDRAALRAELAAPDLWIGPGAVARAVLLEAGHVDDMLDIGPGDGGSSREGGAILKKLSTEEAQFVAGGLGTTIVVTGPDDDDDNWSPWDDDPLDPVDNDGNPDGDWGGPGGSGPDGDQNTNPYAERVTIDPTVPADQRERAEFVRDKLAAELRDVGEKINSLTDNQIYRYGEHLVTGAELKAEFAKIGFNITWNENYGPIGRGANNNGIVSANLSFLEGQLAQNYPWGDWGTNWLILHELSHLLGSVEAFLSDRWNEYIATDPTPTRDEFQLTPGFRANESLTDYIAYMLGALWDLPTGAYPPPGYNPNLANPGGVGTGGGGGSGGSGGGSGGGGHIHHD